MAIRRDRSTGKRPGPEPAKRSVLLELAGKAFARHGLEGASLREICRDGSVSIGLIRHHFGSKDALYEAVINHELRRVHPTGELILPPPEDVPAETRLAELLRHIVRMSLATREGDAILAGVLLHELRSPTRMLPILVERFAVPLRDVLEPLIAELSGQTDAAWVRSKALHVMLLATQLDTDSPVLTLLGLSIPRSTQEINAFADGICDLVLNGVRRSSDAIRLTGERRC